MKALCVVTIAGLCACGVAAIAPGARLIVLRAGEAMEYDASSFAVTRTLALPKEAAEHPERLAANAAGQLLFTPSSDAPLWFWNGQSVRFVDRGARHVSRRSGGQRLSVDAIPQCVLSADGQSLYWFENEFRSVGEATPGAVTYAWVKATFRAWRSDLTGRGRTPVASFSFPACRCGTGECSETCPEVSVWAPDEGIDSFFIATRWIPGQIGTTYVSSALYRRGRGGWTATSLPRALEAVLDASRAGDVIVHAIRDAGCCGWANESDDRTLLARRGRTIKLFDEREAFGNENYDVSFFTADARLSPASHFVAMTVASTLVQGEEVRLSIDGKANAVELERIRRSAAALPAVVVLDVRRDTPVQTLRLDRASLVGWLDESRILVRRGGGYEVIPLLGGTPSRVEWPDGGTVLIRSR